MTKFKVKQTSRSLRWVDADANVERMVKQRFQAHQKVSFLDYTIAFTVLFGALLILGVIFIALKDPAPIGDQIMNFLNSLG